MRNQQDDKARADHSQAGASDLLELRQQVISLASEAMLPDAYYARERVVRLISSNLHRKSPAKAAEILVNLKKRLEQSAAEKSARQRKNPASIIRRSCLLSGTARRLFRPSKITGS